MALPVPAVKSPSLDPVLAGVAAFLLVFGFVMMTSASMHLNSADGFYYAKHQLAHLCLGLLAATVMTLIPTGIGYRVGPVLMLMGVLLLGAVLIPGLGVNVNGSTRWLNLGGIRLQVSELFKCITVIYVAGYAVRHQQDLRQSFSGVLRPLLLLAVAAILLLVEPDFGATVIVMATALGMLFLGGARVLPLLGLFAGLMVTGSGLVFYKSYRWERVVGFLDPLKHAHDSGYQLLQSLIAFSRGGVFGVGVGNSVQKMSFLPEGHTDFLLAVIGEELGWVGVSIVIVAYGLLLWRIFTIARLAETAGQLFGAMLAYGVGLWLGMQAIINMGVNLGVLPTKGLTLPLLSYGGGSLVADCIALGMVQRVCLEAREGLAAQPKDKPW